MFWFLMEYICFTSDVKEIESTTAELRAFEYLDPFEVNGESFYEVFDKLRNDMSSGVCWCHPYRNVMHIDWREVREGKGRVLHQM
jgi:hypothetical protein